MHVLRVDERLVETARARSTAEREMAVSAEQLFATLEDGPSWSKWVPVIREATWTSPMPFGVGTTRTVIVAGGIRNDEEFWTWEPNRRMGFSITAASRRWVDALSELYEIAPISSECCRLRWTMAMSLPGVLSRIEPYIGRGISIAQARMLNTLERVAREHSSRV
jgi:hypothetical protein